MRYWVYKCSTRGANAGNTLSGDWEAEHAFGGGHAPFGWGYTSEVRGLDQVKVGDRVIAHQSDRARLVGVAKVLGFPRGEIQLKVLEDLRVNMRDLKNKYPDVWGIPAYQPGPYHSIYEISSSDAETLLRRARAERSGDAKPIEPLTKQEKNSLARTAAKIKELPAHDRALLFREIQRAVRNALFRPSVLGVWFQEGGTPGCAACGKGIATSGARYECEVAHIVDKWAKGKEQIRNGIPLCRSHHWAFDNHLWGIRPNTLKIVVRKEWRSNALLRSIHGKKVVRPSAREGVEPMANKELQDRWMRFEQAGH